MIRIPLPDVRPWLANLRYCARHPYVRRGTIAAAGALAFMLLAYAGLWWGAARAHAALMEQIESRRRAVVDTMHAGEVARAFQRARRDIDAVERKLVAAVEQAVLVEKLGRLARSKNVMVVSESYEEGKALGAGYTPLIMDITLQGSYPGMREFLLGLPALPALIEVQDARIERARETAGVLKARLRLVAYRKPARGESPARP